MHRQDKFYIFIYSSYMMMCPIPFFYYFLPVCMFVLFFVQTISRNSCSSSGSNNNNSTKASPMCRITGGNHSLKIIHITTLAGVHIIHYIQTHVHIFVQHIHWKSSCMTSIKSFIHFIFCVSYYIYFTPCI